MHTPWDEIKTPELIAHSQLITESYSALLKEEIIPQSESAEEAAYMLYHSDAVVLSHDGASDPCFTYANITAQKLWEYNWHEFQGLPSKYSAEADQREVREALLDEVTKNGFIKNYKGIRVSKSKKRFYIENVAVWNLLANNKKVGQAATFTSWKFL